jgi:predicted ester cyclase
LALSNKDLFLAIIERGFSKGDLSVADEVCAPNLIEHQYLSRAHLSGPEILKDQIATARATVQGLTLTAERIVEDGDAIWALLRGFGTESRSGKSVDFAVMDICRFENGKLIEHWGIPDRFAIMHQSGALPPPPAR